jgi:serine O-acetyltransferase
VVVGAGATLLGAITIGDNARIGAGSVVVQDVPAGATVVGVPGRVVTGERPAEALEHGRMPDPVSEAIGHILDDHAGLAERLRRIEESLNIHVEDEKKKRGDSHGMAHG